MTAAIEVLKWRQWVRLEEAHRSRLLPYAEAYRNRRSLGHKHPVEDFLFQYYANSPGQLLCWHPGIGRAVSLEHAAAHGQPPSQMRRSPYRTEQGLVFADPERIADPELHRIRWIASLLEAIDSRPPQLGCHGLHEWAMVYGSAQDAVRHAGMPLRLPPEKIRRFVDSQRLCCTHYDAFRFFTKQAVDLNAHQLEIESRMDYEQPGCIHVNMDLYKWASKLSPWVSGELLADCFLLAVTAREIDMRASPYDLSDLGCLPIRIETPDGREAYRREQIELFRRATALRRRLLAVARRVISWRWQAGEVAAGAVCSEVAGTRCGG